MTLELPAVVADDVLPGVVVLPRSSTPTFANALADDAGRVHVTLTKVASAAPAAAAMAEVGA